MRAVKAPWRERARAEWGKLRGMSARGRVSYLFCYYKLWLLGLALALLALFFLGDALLQARKETVLQGFYTNDDRNLFDAGELARDYGGYLGLGGDRRVVFDDSLYIDLDGAATEITASSRAKILAYMAVGELDFVVTTREVMEGYVEQAPVLDFRELLPADLLERLGPDLYETRGEAGKPSARALSMRSLAGPAAPGSGDFYMFVPATAPHPDAVAAYIRYLLCVRPAAA